MLNRVNRHVNAINPAALLKTQFNKENKILSSPIYTHNDEQPV